MSKYKNLVAPSVRVPEKLLGFIYTFPKRDRDKVLILCHCLVEAQKNRQNHKRDPLTNRKNGFVTLHWEILRNHTRDYVRIKNLLLQSQVWETDGTYYITDKDKGQAGESTGYRFTLDYVSGIVSVPLRDKVVINAVRRIGQDNEKECRKHTHLRKWFQHRSLTLNIEEARNYFSNQYTVNTTAGDAYSVLKYQIAEDLINLASYKEYPFQVDAFGKRLHSIHTQSPRALRKFWRFNGAPLWEIDIKNCQPFLTLLLLNPEFYAGGAGASYLTIHKLGKEAGLSSREIKQISNYYLKSYSEAPDVKRYRELVLSGHIYEYFGNALYERGVCSIAELKDRKGYLKPALFRVLFGRNRSYGTSTIKQTFYDLFPTVAALFKEFKKQDHRVMSCITQRAEAFIVLENITRAINEEVPGAPVFTIHDGIASTEEHMPGIRAIMEREIKKLTGLSPVLSDAELW